jgi:hypothetical protein
MSTGSRPLRLSLPDGGLHVAFVWQGDRFAHEFVWDNGLRVPSVEGSAEQAWPPSPPLQQLSIERIGDADAILGVGAAGQSHWSISVEVTQEHERYALKFDLACRFKLAPEWLGSTYRGSEQLRFLSLFDNTRVDDENGLVVIRPSCPTGSQTVRWGYSVSAVKSGSGRH